MNLLSTIRSTYLISSLAWSHHGVMARQRLVGLTLNLIHCNDLIPYFYFIILRISRHDVIEFQDFQQVYMKYKIAA
jgi:hypothetical protein